MLIGLSRSNSNRPRRFAYTPALRVVHYMRSKKVWSGRVDSNHRPPGPEPDNGSPSKLLKTRYFQVVKNKAVLLKLVEIDCALWNFGALVYHKIIYGSHRSLRKRSRFSNERPYAAPRTANGKTGRFSSTTARAVSARLVRCLDPSSPCGTHRNARRVPISPVSSAVDWPRCPRRPVALERQL